jgi:transitional endoplasmic reticulum ATPase
MTTNQSGGVAVAANGDKHGSDKYSELREQLSEVRDREAKQGIKFSSVDVLQSAETKQIVLPEGMSSAEARKWLERWEKQQEQEVAISIEVDAFPMDGALALAKTLKDLFGWTNLVTVPGGFFEPDQPPVMVQIEVAPGVTQQVPWGRMTIPGVDGYIETSIRQKGLNAVFAISGVTRRKHEKLVKQIGDLVRQRIKVESIYRGKAIRHSYRNSNGERLSAEPRQFNPLHAPKFIDTDAVRPEELIFPKKTSDLIETCLYNPVRKTAACRRQGIPLKRGVMLEGPYGVGKSLCAYVLAKLCVEHGWTFLYIDDVRDLDIALSVAQLYQPCVVFAEDINRVVGANRDAEVDRVLNTLDGVVSKSSEIITVVTTNEVNQIHKALVRPGRIDTVVPVRAPDAEAAMRLIRLYGRGTVICNDVEIGSAVQGLVRRGATAAVFREVIERAKLAALSSLDDSEAKIAINAEHLVVACRSLEEHIRLMESDGTKEPHAMELFGGAVGKALSGGVTTAIQIAAEQLSEMLEYNDTNGPAGKQRLSRLVGAAAGSDLDRDPGDSDL